MSDTPRTDEQCISVTVDPWEEDDLIDCVPADFARQLERELAATTKERDELREALYRLRDCDFVISLPDRMDAVREIARAALAKSTDA